MAAPPEPHSKEHLRQRSRSFLWEVDYLRLMAGRLQLDRVRDALDVGCGIGHWSFALGQVLPPTARLTGVDAEERWVAEASSAARERGLAGRFVFQQGRVERLAFPDGSFDLVTCQTLLIHVADELGALREMVRVLRPGGLLVAAEPANRAHLTLSGSLDRSVEQQLEILHLFLTCERGKAACGEGDISMGDRLPGLLASLQLRDITVRQSEHAAALFPPYDTPQQQAEIADLRERVRRGVWWIDRETLYRHYRAGGGAPERFERAWQAALAERRSWQRSTQARTTPAAARSCTWSPAASREAG